LGGSNNGKWGFDHGKDGEHMEISWDITNDELFGGSII
jgi:hypothetical protein